MLEMRERKDLKETLRICIDFLQRPELRPGRMLRMTLRNRLLASG